MQSTLIYKAMLWFYFFTEAFYCIFLIVWNKPARLDNGDYCCDNVLLVIWPTDLFFVGKEVALMKSHFPVIGECWSNLIATIKTKILTHLPEPQSL